MSNDVTPEMMQSRIQAARREAEGLKDRIKRKKDELADTTREFYHLLCGFIGTQRVTTSVMFSFSS